MNYYNKNIKNVRGDTYSLGLTTDLELDTIFFTCRDSLNDNSTILFQKYLGNGISITEEETTEEGTVYKYAVRIAPADTDNIQAGTYYYDLQITINNDVFTIMKGKYIIEQDATRSNEPVEDEIIVQIKAVLDEINGETVSVDVFDKLDYLSTTKTLIKDSLNTLGAELTSSDTFRSYAEAIENIYDNYPRITGEGTELSLNTIKAPIEIILKGSAEQITYTGKNLFDTSIFPINVVNATGEQIENGLRITSTADGISGSNYLARYILFDMSDRLGQTFTLSSLVATSSTNHGRYVIQTCDINGENRSTIAVKDSLTNGKQTVSFTLPLSISGNSKYLVIALYSNNNDSTSVTGDYVDYSNLQLEAGTVPTDYEPYVGGVPIPNLDNPQEIKTVTGNNTIYISDGTNTQNYTISLENIELCKIGNNQDVIIKDNDIWLIPNKILKIDSYNGETITTDYISTTGGLDTGSTVYYVGTSDLEITDATLITQLEALSNAYSYNGTTTISSEYSETNAQIIISASALMKGEI